MSSELNAFSAEGCPNCGSDELVAHEVVVDHSGETVVVAKSCQNCHEILP